MSDNNDIDITLDNENENIDVNEENYVYINIPESVIEEMQQEILLRSLITETGSQIVLEIDNETYKFKAKLKDKNGNIIYTSNEIDLPLESVVIDGEYDSVNKKLILTLQNGNTIGIGIEDLISGLVNEDTFNEAIEALEDEIEALQERDELIISQIPTGTAENIDINLTDSSNLNLVDIQIKGNTSQTITSISGGDEYDSPSPDHEQPINVVTGENTVKIVGKNLYDGQYSAGRGINSNGVEYSTTGQNASKNYIPVTPNTTCTLYIPSKIYAVAKYKKDKTLISRATLSNATTYTFKTSADCYFIKFSGYSDNWEKVQFEYGDTATAFESYTVQSQLISLGSMELCKIGNYQDRIYYDKTTSKWYKYGAIQKDILDGTTAWTVSDAGTANWFYKTGTTGRTAETGFCLCNYYTFAGNTIKSTNTIQGISVSNITSTSAQFRIRYGTEDTANNFQAWVSNHNLVVYSILETPTLTEITDTTLIGQLNSLYNSSTYKNTTNIFTLTASLEPELKVEYKKDISLWDDIIPHRVNTFQDLEKACTNADITDIYIDSDIDISAQINITGDKNIYGNGHTLTGSNSITYMFYITNKCVNLYDLVLLGANDDVIYVGGTATANIVRCDISNSYANDGIGLHGNANCYIYNCKIHDNYDEGLSTHDTSYCEVYNTEAYKNGYVVGTSTRSGISFGGLHFGGSRMGKVENCYCYENDYHGIGFITIDNNYSSSAECVCINNVCLNNAESGIRFGGASNIRCSNNMCCGNQNGIIFAEKSEHGNSGYIGNNSLFNNIGSDMTVWTGADDGLVFISNP